MDACRVQRRRRRRAGARGAGGGAARASVCIRHIYPDSGRASSLTRPNARPAYVGRDAHAVSLVPPHRTPMQKANTVRQVGTHAFLIICRIPTA